MKYVCLNPRALDAPEKMHAYLKDALSFPEYYGMNLDALFDVLSTYDQGARILCLRFEREGRALYPFADRFYRVIADAAAENPALTLDVQTLEAV